MYRIPLYILTVHCTLNRDPAWLYQLIGMMLPWNKQREAFHFQSTTSKGKYSENQKTMELMFSSFKVNF